MDYLAQVLGVGGCLAGAVIWICKQMLEPQRLIIQRINNALDRWNDTMDRHQAAIHELELTVRGVDERGKSNTHRLDDLEKEVRIH